MRDARLGTGHTDVDALLAAILAGARAALGDGLVGMYLHGSLALGDFDPTRSDVDFLVVSAAELGEAEQAALAAGHQRIAASDLAWKTNYEGSYIPAAALRRYDPAASVHPAVQVDGRFGLAPHGHDWIIQRFVIREHGVPLTGPPPASLIDPIPPDVLRDAARRTLTERWLPELADSSGLQTSEYQAYAILTMCRSLYTLRHGDVVSKPTAARWAAGRHAEWAGLIRQALAWRHGVHLDRLPEVLAFIRFTLDRESQSTDREE